MRSKTLQEGLDDYRIGPKIRGLRLTKKIGLVDLGKHTGLSGAALDDRARTPVSDATDAAAYRAGLWRRPGILLRRRAGKP